MLERENYITENPKKNLLAEPSLGDNSNKSENGPEKGVKPDNTDGLILGKFKSVEDLSKAYVELTKKHGIQSKEIGELRHIAEEYANHQAKCRMHEQRLSEFQELVKKMNDKYDNENYLKNKEFRDILMAAYQGFGNNLDVDSMVDLLEKYHNSRTAIANKVNALQSEADAATDMLAYTNGQSKFKGSKKRLYEMTPEELNKALDELM